MNGERLGVVVMWICIAAFFALLWKFPGLDQWLFAPFRDHLSAIPSR